MSNLYRKKPVTIEAVQLNWANWNQICDFLGDIISPVNPGRTSTEYSETCGEETSGDCQWIEITIPTLEGDHIARHGDWIIKGVKGEFYPCKPDIFRATYEPAEQEEINRYSTHAEAMAKAREDAIREAADVLAREYNICAIPDGVVINGSELTSPASCRDAILALLNDGSQNE